MDAEGKRAMDRALMKLWGKLPQEVREREIASMSDEDAEQVLQLLGN